MDLSDSTSIASNKSHQSQHAKQSARWLKRAQNVKNGPVDAQRSIQKLQAEGNASYFSNMGTASFIVKIAVMMPVILAIMYQQNMGGDLNVGQTLRSIRSSLPGSSYVTQLGLHFEKRIENEDVYEDGESDDESDDEEEDEVCHEQESAGNVELDDGL